MVDSELMVAMMDMLVRLGTGVLLLLLVLLLVVVVLDAIRACAASLGSVLALAATALGVSTGESSLCEGKEEDVCGCSGNNNVLSIFGRDRGSSFMLIAELYLSRGAVCSEACIAGVISALRRSSPCLRAAELIEALSELYSMSSSSSLLLKSLLL